MYNDRENLIARGAKPAIQVQARAIQFERELADIRRDMRAALEIVIACRARPGVSLDGIAAAATHPAGVIDALLCLPAHVDLSGERELLTAQLLQVFVMRECRNATLSARVLRNMLVWAADGYDVVVHSAYPAVFVEAALERFGILPCVMAIASQGEIPLAVPAAAREVCGGRATPFARNRDLTRLSPEFA